MSNKQGKMAGYINYRMRVTLMDGRQMTGQMLAFDKHMNLVLADTEEFRRVKRKQNKPAAPGASGSATQTIESEEKRTLGLTIVRGAQIVSLSVESAPPPIPAHVSERLLQPACLQLSLQAQETCCWRWWWRTCIPPQFPGAPGFGPGRGGPPAPGFPPGGFPPAGFPPNTGFQPPPGFPGGAGAPPPGFNPPGRR
ncbi:Sm-like ribonucleoprotein [Apiospora sp. TS-2023a]